MKSAIPTKKQLIKGFNIESFKPRKQWVFKGWKEVKERDHVWHVPIYEDVDCSDLQAHSDDFLSRIFPGGKVTLECGSIIFEGYVKGRNFNEVKKKAVALLHKRIMESKLN